MHVTLTEWRLSGRGIYGCEHGVSDEPGQVGRGAYLLRREMIRQVAVLGVRVASVHLLQACMVRGISGGEGESDGAKAAPRRPNYTPQPGCLPGSIDCSQASSPAEAASSFSTLRTSEVIIALASDPAEEMRLLRLDGDAGSDWLSPSEELRPLHLRLRRLDDRRDGSAIGGASRFGQARTPPRKENMSQDT